MGIGNMGDYFQTSTEHLMAEIKRIKIMLRLRSISSVVDTDMENNFEGLFVTDREIENIFNAESNNPKEEPLKGKKDNQKETFLLNSIHQLGTEIAEKSKESRQQGIELRLETLKQLFDLTPFDIDIILLCILPEIDLKYRKVYAYLQNDITQKNPTINLALDMLCQSDAGKFESRRSFIPESTLIKYQLIHLHDNNSTPITPLYAKLIGIDERITDYLLEIDRIDSCLLPFAKLLKPRMGIEEMILPEGITHFLNTLMQQKSKAPVCHLYGDKGTGKQSTAEAICMNSGMPILYVELNRMLLNKSNIENILPLIMREGMLQNAALYLNGYDTLLSDETAARLNRDYLIETVKKYPQWVFVAGNEEWRPKETWHDRPFVSIELPVPSYSERKQLWNKYWEEDLITEKDVDFNDLASKFRLTGGQIRNVIMNARNAARLKPAEQQTVNAQELSSFCRNESREVLHNMARKIKPRYHWNDIVLPDDLLQQLREIYNHIKYYYKVYSDWGFENKLSLGKGLNVLFSGSSGTGKTMAAEIVANELQLDLYKIDLSTIVSKYIGETEKNLNLIFKEGQASNAILFFDEADAIFGKRSEVKDAHDRYANIEIAYLLQKMEEYDGMVILATNFRKNIDEAFSRRMHFSLDFPVPDEANRKRIWQAIFPADAPVDPNLDYDFIAGQYQVTGGNIKNIALSAAFLAAQNGNLINMSNITRAIKREYQKIGKLLNDADFADHPEIVN